MPPTNSPAKPGSDALKYWAPIVLEHIKKIPEIVDVNSDQQDNGLQSSVVVDRDTASRLGLTAAQIDAALVRCLRAGAGFDHVYAVESVSRRDGGRAQILAIPGDVETRLHPQSRRGRRFRFPRSPISCPATRLSPSPTRECSRRSRFPSACRKAFPSAQAVDAIDDAEVDMGLPVTVVGKFAGTAQAFQDSLKSEPDPGRDGSDRRLYCVGHAL